MITIDEVVDHDPHREALLELVGTISGIIIILTVMSVGVEMIGATPETDLFRRDRAQVSPLLRAVRDSPTTDPETTVRLMLTQNGFQSRRTSWA